MQPKRDWRCHSWCLTQKGKSDDKAFREAMGTATVKAAEGFLRAHCSVPPQSEMRPTSNSVGGLARINSKTSCPDKATTSAFLLFVQLNVDQQDIGGRRKAKKQHAARL